MKPRPHTGWFGTLLVLVALLSTLVAPVASLSHGGQPVTPSGLTDQQHGGCGGCADQQEQTDQDGCCTSSACSCACHAPLLTRLQLPPLPLARFEAAREPAYHLPLVYLAIFVPPQNRS